MTVATSTENQHALSSNVKSPSIGGVPLEIESTEVESSKSPSSKCSLGPRKVLMILWNMKAFILVIWGFYGMLDAVIRASAFKGFDEFFETSTITSIQEKVSGTFDDLSISHFNKYHLQTQCFNAEKTKNNIETFGYPLFFPFMFFNVAWMLWIIIRSNILRYGTDELGFHVSLVEIRKKRSYKAWAILDGVYCLCVLMYGLKQLSNDDDDNASRTVPVLLNGAFQVFLGLWDLYSPLEETLSYGEGAMVSPIKCSLTAEAGKAINRYQDAMLAALARGKSNMKWIEEATGSTKEECEQVLFHISANEHPSEKEKKGFSFC